MIPAIDIQYRPHCSLIFVKDNRTIYVTNEKQASCDTFYPTDTVLFMLTFLNDHVADSVGCGRNDASFFVAGANPFGRSERPHHRLGFLVNAACIFLMKPFNVRETVARTPLLGITVQGCTLIPTRLLSDTTWFHLENSAAFTGSTNDDGVFLTFNT